METALRRQVLANQYRTYLEILHQRGLSYDTPDDKDIEKMPDPDLATLVRSLRDLARTPSADR